MEIVDHFYTGKQAAELLCVKRITIWRWIKQGRFSVQRIGGIVLIPKWQVDLLREKRNGNKIVSVSTGIMERKENKGE